MRRDAKTHPAVPMWVWGIRKLVQHVWGFIPPPMITKSNSWSLDFSPTWDGSVTKRDLPKSILERRSKKMWGERGANEEVQQSQPA